MAYTERFHWWQHGVIYQVYPRSFLDTDGDGVGDLAGIRQRLPYLEWLGVDALWISPFFPSPMKDCGYDVADYCGVDPLFGTLAEFDALLEAAHARGLRVILDLVPNHTSDQHPWFVESRSSRASSKRGWYLWRDPAPGGGPPSNWLSEFGGSAWEWDGATEQYFYHAFLPEQPDLDWRNPEVRAAMTDVMRFWLARGVDGFRVDVLWHLIKDAELRDDPPNPDYTPDQKPYRAQLPVYSSDRPEVHEVVALLRRTVDEFRAEGERVLIGEVYLPPDELVRYYGEHGSGAHLPFNFQLVLLPWDALRIGAAVTAYEASLPPHAWPNWVLGNHDQPRVATRIGRAQAPVAAVLLLTLRGTPTMYYGDELGLTDVAIPPEALRDPLERRMPGRGQGRDPQRTPMPWDASPHAGFTAGTPWLPLGPDWRAENVAAQRDDPTSLLNLYRRLLALRRATPALAVGDYRPLAAPAPLLAYVRAYEDERVLVVLNLSAAGHTLRLPADAADGEVLLSTRAGRESTAVAGFVRLAAGEAVVVRLESPAG